MRVGLSTAAFYGQCETEDAASRLTGFGVPCCEVFLETFSEYSAAFGRLVRERLDGIEAVSIHVKTQHFEPDLVGSSPRQRQDALDNLAKAMDAGAALGARFYAFHGPMYARGGKPDFAPWVDFMRNAQELCAERGITLCWETVSWCALQGPQRAREILDVWPDMGFVLDVKQALETGYDPLEYMAVMGNRLLHVHVLDYDAGGKHALPSQGCYDFAKLAQALRAQSYAGDIILEPYGYMTSDTEALRASLDFLRGVFERPEGGEA